MIPLRSPEEFLHSLRDDRRVIYRGQAVEDVTAHPHLGRGAAHVAVDFRLAHERSAEPLFVDRDDPDRPASRCFTIPRNTSDLVRRRDVIEQVTREARSFVPIVKEIGTDALFALMIVTAQVARTLDTPYHERVRAYYERCRDGDLAMAVAQTDAKGDRSRRPSEQAHPDVHVHRVRETREGIIVRGAKAHTTNAVFANEIIVLPTRAMAEADADYAVAFAVPANTPGLTMVASPRGFSATSEFDNPLSSRYSLTESLTVFDDVLVPWEARVPVRRVAVRRRAREDVRRVPPLHRRVVQDAAAGAAPRIRRAHRRPARAARRRARAGQARPADHVPAHRPRADDGRGVGVPDHRGNRGPEPDSDERREVSVRARLPRRGAGRAGSRRGSDRDRARGRGLGGARGARADRAVPGGGPASAPRTTCGSRI